MDAFVKDLYQGDLTKQASADLQALYAGLSTGELMELAGVKMAVAGPTAPVAPTGTAAAAAKVTATAPAKKTTPPELPTEKKAAKLDQARFLKMAMRSSADAPDSVRVAAIRLAAPVFMKTARPTMGRSPALGMSDKVPFPGQFDEFDAGEASLAKRGPTLAGPTSKTGVTQNAKLQSPFGRTVAQGKPLAQAGGAATAGGAPYAGATLRGQAPISLKPLTPGAAMTTGSVGKDLSVGWQAAGKHLAKAPGAFMSRPGQALRMMKAPGLSLASRAGTAARMIAPHAGLIGGGLLAAHALAGRSQNG